MGKGFKACASSSKGNLKANNCMSILSSSLEALFLVRLDVACLGSMSMSRKGKTLLELGLNCERSLVGVSSLDGF